ncbi:phytoene/squalene synthase family protein [Nevskia soli]|uniref:phytoene/squalene synthase family protein n=1 Tax=Nevskia soli TaxID=418856 RepID=UPI0015D81451|nr:phytoene/squalene synthase family protein [Nevskia soli]
MNLVWNQEEWRQLERETAQRILLGAKPQAPWAAAARAARLVLRTYSTSFFIVTRFLPPVKRRQVEVIYAAVRYPDEIVDTFPIPAAEQNRALDRWTADYEHALACGSVQEAVAAGANCFAGAFGQVVRTNGIPQEYYRSFLAAMRLDVTPRPFETLEDLIDNYIYGSATVVGYFLAYVYGPSAPAEFDRALRASRDLAIALQLTNFLRDVPDDRRRGRTYLPCDFLGAEGLSVETAADPDARPALDRVLRRLSRVAEEHYAAAERDLDAFAPDCRIAIQACINVYRQLNLRIGASQQGVMHRERVPMVDKFRVLPPSKYWRLPLAYLGAI